MAPLDDRAARAPEAGPLPFGAALRESRIAAGFSLQALGNQVHYSRSHLSKVENGIKAPTPELARLCDAVLGGDLPRLARRPRRTGTRIPAPRSGHSRPDLAAPPPVVSWPEPLPLSEFQATFGSLRQLSQSVSPRAVIPALIGYGESLIELAGGTRSELRDAVYRLAARFVEHAGWLAQELGDAARAIAWTDWAAQVAALGGEDLTAFRFVRQGDLAMYAGDAEGTVSWATLALQCATDNRIRGLAAQRLAQGHAIAGDRDACLRALDLAGDLLARVPAGSDQPPLGSATVVDHGAMARGWCLFDLTEPRRAAEIMAVEVDRLPAFAVRARSRYGARLARAHAGNGDFDQACAAARPVLLALPALDSATIRVDISALEATLRRRRRHPAVAAMLPLFSAARARSA